MKTARRLMTAASVGLIMAGASAGWAQMSRRADSLAGLNSELRFHVDSDTTVNFQGLAIDDVSVTGCRALSADLAITKTHAPEELQVGAQATYTLTVTNAVPMFWRGKGALTRV